MLPADTFKINLFLSTPSARRATARCCRPVKGRQISIHALREEGDQGCGDPATPAGGFLSTPSARRATSQRSTICMTVIYFYPRPPRGGRPLPSSNASPGYSNFYPRPPRGGRPDTPVLASVVVIFLSTPSARRATQSPSSAARWTTYFYPRPPRGGRQQKQREHPLLLSYYTPLCTNCKEASATRTAAPRRFLHKRLVFRCEASRNTMCAARSHWLRIKRSVRYPVQTPGAVQRARPWSGSCCPADRIADCLTQGRSERSALP